MYRSGYYCNSLKMSANVKLLKDAPILVDLWVNLAYYKVSTPAMLLMVFDEVKE